MPVEITMPQLSDTMTEGTVVKWIKHEGDAVKAGEEIAEVETDKATMPMESFEGGTIAAVLIDQGQKVAVGQILAVVATKGEDVAAIKQKYAAANPTPATPAVPSSAAPAPNAVAGGRAPSAASAAPATASAAPTASSASASPAPAPTSADPAPAGASAERIISSPLARRVASDLGIDLSTVQGTGPSGRIIQRDVQTARSGQTATPARQPTPPPQAAPLQPRPLSGRNQIVPLTKMRLTIAARLQASKQNLPHFYEMVEIDCENVLALRGKLNDLWEKEGIRLSLADFITKALAVALQQHPSLNATFDGQQVTLHGDINLGIAVSLPGGLIVPVLRGINQMGLKEIRQRTADLIDRARQQKLKAEELSGGTFTISSLGGFGIREFTAIINPPEVAILAIGSAEKRPAVINNQIVPRTLMTVCLSSDHRVIDGAQAADFLRTFKRLMEEPALMLV